MKKEDYTTCRHAVLVDCGRGGTRTHDLTDVNRYNENRVRDVILLVVELFNN